MSYIKLLWLLTLSVVTASCTSDSGEISERSYANDVLVDSEWIEANMDDFLSRLPVASNSDIKKLERKVNALTKKVRALEKQATA